MKLDWKCVRAILEALEEKPDAHTFIKADAFPDYSAGVFGYHVQLLERAGYVEAKVFDMLDAPVVAVASSLTLEGQDLLAKMRSEALWRRMLKMCREKGVELSFEAVKVFSLRALEQLAKR